MRSRRSARITMHKGLLILACFICLQFMVNTQHNSSLYYGNHNHQHNRSSDTATHLYNKYNTSDNKYYDAKHYMPPKLNTSRVDYDEDEDDEGDVEDLDLKETNYELYEYLRRSSIIFGLASMANGSNVNAACSRQMKQIQYGILRKEPWAMKVLDASATKPSGFVFGQNFWLGSREACGAVKRPIALTLNRNYERIMHYAIITEPSPFDVSYRVVYLRHNSPWQIEIKMMSEEIIHIGLCLPTTCTSDEIKELSKAYFEEGIFVENDIFDIRAQVVYVKDFKLRESFYKRLNFKMMSAFLTFTSLMLLAAAFLRMKPTAERKEQKNVVANGVVNITANGVVNITAQQLNASSDDVKPCHSIDALAAGVGPNALRNLRDFVKCFDFLENYDKMFTLKENVSREIPVINGLRSVCSIWIVLFHMAWYTYFTVHNKAFLISYGEHIFFQYVSSAPLLVDVFFTISGFLQTYNFLRNAKQLEIIRTNSLWQNVKQFFKLLFHRYLRLAPLYLLIVGTVDLFYAYIRDISVYHISDRFDEKCSKYWWRNLLFIQNYWDHNEMCLNWTWSLACEMQYYVLATILLFTYAKNPRLVKGFTVTIFAGTIIWTYSIGFGTKFQLSFDSAFATGTDIYISPFVRVLPYVMGAITAWNLLERQSQFDLSEMKEKCFWNLAILTFFCCIYSTFKRDLSVLASVTLIVAGRFLFGLSICWTILGSATGRGTWWSRILEGKVFQHINRVTYAIYLLNPFVIAFVFSLTNASTHADPLVLSVLTSGFIVIVYLLAVLFSLAFEVPYCNWSNLILKGGSKKKLL
ncbi:nose resistant to fluoxetine protein 6-like [Eurosta solidaginis]|uniref:nose resistant to fluoxetine protein 6-like n=1 Tax=Eurosta solidaginis TaxID=178769 RepID=UPI0035310963